MLDLAKLETYLRDWLQTDARIVKTGRSVQGLSRETWFITLSDRRITLRCDLAGAVSSVPVSLEQEYRLQERVAGCGLPVTRPLHFEQDTTILGFPFYLREFAEGSPNIAHFADPNPIHDDLRIAASREHVRKMAAVHQVDWRGHGFADLLPAPQSPADSARLAIDRIEADMVRIAPEPNPAISAIADQLRARMPAATPTVVLCKGSNGMLQEVWRGGAIVALSDWEMASLGDPASDWGRCNGLIPEIPGRWGLDHVLAYYEELTGIHIAPETVAFYRLVYAFELMLVGYYSTRPIIDGSLLDGRLALLATLSVHSPTRMLAEALLRD